MLASLSYDMKLACLSVLKSLSELIPGQNGSKELNITRHHDMEASKKETLDRSVTHCHALGGLLIG